MSVQYEFATNWGTTGGDITGIASEWTLDSIEDNGTGQYETFKQQGAREGGNSHFGIDDVGEQGFISTLSASQTDQGDSGGPYHIEVDHPIDPTEGTMVFPDGFEPDAAFDLVAGIHQGNDFPYTAATSMYVVEDEWSVTI